MGFFKKLFKGIGKGVKGLIQGVTGMQLGDGNKAVEVKLIQPPSTPYNGEKGFGVKLLQDPKTEKLSWWESGGKAIVTIGAGLLLLFLLLFSLLRKS